jgi:hypothetical protein
MLPPIAGAACARRTVCPFDIRVVSTALIRGCVKMRARQVLDMSSPPPDWRVIRAVCGLYEHLDRSAVWTGVTELVEREVAHTALLRATPARRSRLWAKDTHGGHRVAASSASIEGLYQVMHLRGAPATNYSVLFRMHGVAAHTSPNTRSGSAPLDAARPDRHGEDPARARASVH